MTRPHLRRRLTSALGLVSLLSAACCASGPRFSGDDTAKVDNLLVLVRQRLEVAPEVARVKWNTKAPIEDLPREKQIVDGVARTAPDRGLDPAVAAAFFQGQIDASKVVQRALHEQWTAKAQPPFEKVPDLVKDIRPVLDRLTPALVEGLAEAMPVLSRPGAGELLAERTRSVLAGAPGGDAAVEVAVAPLRKVSK
jgi:chorismate mutase